MTVQLRVNGRIRFGNVPGRNQLVLPFAYDQLDNAIRIKRLGAGEWIRARRASGRRIAKSRQRLLSSGVRERCRARAAAFDRNGISIAADRIVEMVAKHRSGGV